MKKIIIAGSRHMRIDHDILDGLLGYAYPHDRYEIISGGASGIDTVAQEYAVNRGYTFTLFPADWDTHGKAAGPIRNKQMAEAADVLLLIWDGQSKGSANMKAQMKKLGKPVIELVDPRSLLQQIRSRAELE